MSQKLDLFQSRRRSDQQIRRCWKGLEAEAYGDKGFISSNANFQHKSLAGGGTQWTSSQPAGPRCALTLREIWRQLSRRPTMEVAAGRLMGAGQRGMMLS